MTVLRSWVDSCQWACYSSGLLQQGRVACTKVPCVDLPKFLHQVERCSGRLSQKPSRKLVCLVGNMAKSRLSMRREVEAAEAEAGLKKTASRAAAEKKSAVKKRAAKGEKDGVPKKKKAAKPRTRRAKEAMQRRRLVWVVYSSTMREEGRFLFHEKDKADELLATLLGRGKRRYFMQPVKEALNPDGTPIAQVPVIVPDEDVEEIKLIDPEADVVDEIDLDAELEIDGEDAEEAEVEGEAEESATEL